MLLIFHGCLLSLGEPILKHDSSSCAAAHVSNARRFSYKTNKISASIHTLMTISVITDDEYTFA